jgi:hypothetical protein
MVVSRLALRIAALACAAACHSPTADPVAPHPAPVGGAAVTDARAPELFAPGVITGPPTFSPDGNTVYFTRKRTIMVSHRRGDGWFDPEVAPFSGTWGDADPAMAPDGSFLIFASNRPASQPGDPLDGEWGTPERKVFKGQGGNLWRVDRAGDHWGPPRRLPDAVNRGTAVFEPSVVADGSVYFMDAHLPGNFRLYRDVSLNVSRRPRACPQACRSSPTHPSPSAMRAHRRVQPWTRTASSRSASSCRRSRRTSR